MEPVRSINLRRFDLNSIAPDAIIIIIGSRRRGKSWLIRNIIYTMSQRGMPYGKIFSGTEIASPFFSSFFPSLYISKEFNDSEFKIMFDSQAKKTKKHGKQLSNNMLLVFDDMLSDDEAWKKNKYFKRLFVEGRHYNILFIQSLQYVMGLQPALRENVDYAFLYGTDGENNLRKLYENYAGAIPTYTMFKDIFHQCTRDHGCLVIDKTSTSEKLEDRIFHYRAIETPKFKFGSEKFWKMHDDRYLSDNENEDIIEKNRLNNVIQTYAGGGSNVKYTISIEK